MPADLPPWRELDAAELAATRPFLLHCDGLTDRDCAAIRIAFLEAAVAGVHAMAEAVERVPTEAEIHILRSALAKHFNERVIPQLRRGTVH